MEKKKIQRTVKKQLNNLYALIVRNATLLDTNYDEECTLINQIENLIDTLCDKDTLDDFQGKALETAQYPKDYSIIYPALGLNGEAGEVADKIKKIIRDNNAEFSAEKRKEVAMELGDCLWYVAVLAKDLGYSLDEIGKLNYEKLMSRKKRGVISGNGDNR